MRIWRVSWFPLCSPSRCKRIPRRVWNQRYFFKSLRNLLRPVISDIYRRILNERLSKVTWEGYIPFRKFALSKYLPDFPNLSKFALISAYLKTSPPIPRCCEESLDGPPRRVRHRRLPNVERLRGVQADQLRDHAVVHGGEDGGAGGRTRVIDPVQMGNVFLLQFLK